MRTDCKLDRLDIRILAELQGHGRLPNVALADVVGLSANPCLTRVKRLESQGYITGYGATLSLERIGSIHIVFAKVTLSDHRREDLERFVHAVRCVDEIMECHHATGGYDYMLKVVARDMDHYRSIVQMLMDGDLHIEDITSSVVCKTSFRKADYPLRILFP